jgi:hypothetical protein
VYAGQANIILKRAFPHATPPLDEHNQHTPTESRNSQNPKKIVLTYTLKKKKY